VTAAVVLTFGADAVGSVVLTALADAGLVARLRLVDEVAWTDVARRLGYMPVHYSPAMIDYQLTYWSGNGVPIMDVSLVLVHDNRPCGIWPLSITLDTQGNWRIGSSGGPAIPPLFVSGMAQKSIKSITAGCLAFIDGVCQRNGQSDMDIAEVYTGTNGLSEWHDRLMQAGARAELRHDLFLDLSPSIAEIKSTFRRSYKSLITSGEKLWKVELATAADPALWDEFRILHRAVAGRVTRSEESWRFQHDAIVSGDAFFVCLRDIEGRMVGGGLFYTTAHEGLYAIGAYDRSLFEKPLGHVVQYHAIEEMKRRGISWYNLGTRYYPGQIPTPSDKEIAISNFKQGFSSHLFPRYLVHHRPPKAEVIRA
jgi:FemAB family protein